MHRHDMVDGPLVLHRKLLQKRGDRHVITQVHHRSEQALSGDAWSVGVGQGAGQRGIALTPHKGGAAVRVARAAARARRPTRRHTRLHVLWKRNPWPHPPAQSSISFSMWLSLRSAAATVAPSFSTSATMPLPTVVDASAHEGRDGWTGWGCVGSGRMCQIRLCWPLP